MIKGSRRERILKRLHHFYVPYYEKLCELLPNEWQPLEGYRSAARQQALFCDKKKVTKAKAMQSAHNYGLATDWTIFDEDDEPIWLDVKNKSWGIYEMACQKSGLIWGGHFKSIVDYYHNEIPLQCSWKKVGEVYVAQGLDAAFEFIKKNMS